jgi:hypothetical protein
VELPPGIATISHFSTWKGSPSTITVNRVGSLYKHVFPPKYAPNLSFVGLPYKVQRFFNEIHTMTKANLLFRLQVNYWFMRENKVGILNVLLRGNQYIHIGTVGSLGRQAHGQFTL